MMKRFPGLDLARACEQSCAFASSEAFANALQRKDE